MLINLYDTSDIRNTKYFTKEVTLMNVNGVLRSTSVERKSSTPKSKEVPTAKEENHSSAAIYEKGTVIHKKHLIPKTLQPLID